MRSRVAWSVVLVLAALAVVAAVVWRSGSSSEVREIDATPAPVPARARDASPDLDSLVAGWTARAASLGEVSPDEYDRELAAYLRGVRWEDVLSLCCRGGDAIDDESLAALAMLARHRVELAPPTADEIAALLTRQDCLELCTWPIVDWVMAARDTLAGAARRRLGLALLVGGADTGLSVQLRRQLLAQAAALDTPELADTLLTAGMRWARGTDTESAVLGVRMIGAVDDPRAADSLAALLRDYEALDASEVDALLEQCRDACAERSLEALLALHAAATAARRQPAAASRRERLALFALARAPQPAAAQRLLAAYDDGGAIADSTFALPEPSRRTYHQLWLATRIAEPHLIEWLRTGPPAEAALATELFDRALRFGPPIDADALVAALLAWRERAPDAGRARIAAVLARAAAPPPAPGTRPAP